MKKIIQAIRSDEEITRIREEWIKLSNEPFWAFNYDEFNGIEDYKKKLKSRLEELKG